MAFAGAAIGCLFLPPLSDYYGRWPVFLFTMVFQLPIYLMIALTSQLWLIYVGVFWMGVLLIGRFVTGFTLLTELVPDKNASFAGTALMVGDSAATLYISFYFRYITPYQNPIVWFGFLLNIVTLIATFWIPESPRWLVSIGDYEGAKRCYQRIANLNRV